MKGRRCHWFFIATSCQHSEMASERGKLLALARECSQILIEGRKAPNIEQCVSSNACPQGMGWKDAVREKSQRGGNAVASIFLTGSRPRTPAYITPNQYVDLSPQPMGAASASFASEQGHI